MPGGRPPKYSSVDALEKKIEEYFDGGYRKKLVRVGNKKDGYEMIEVPAITLTDLCLFLGFADKCSFYDYEKKDEFSHSIKKARTFIEREYEEQLQTNPSGAIFALKNFGWRDKHEIDHTTKGEAIRSISPHEFVKKPDEGE